MIWVSIYKSSQKEQSSHRYGSGPEIQCARVISSCIAIEIGQNKIMRVKKQILSICISLCATFANAAAVPATSTNLNPGMTSSSVISTFIQNVTGIQVSDMVVPVDTHVRVIVTAAERVTATVTLTVTTQTQTQTLGGALWGSGPVYAMDGPHLPVSLNRHPSQSDTGHGFVDILICCALLPSRRPRYNRRPSRNR